MTQQQQQQRVDSHSHCGGHLRAKHVLLVYLGATIVGKGRGICSKKKKYKTLKKTERNTKAIIKRKTKRPRMEKEKNSSRRSQAHQAVDF